MSMPTLFDMPDGARRVRRTDPDTSRYARSGPNTEGEILEVLASGVRMTADELCAQLPARFPPTIKSALARLHHAGLVLDTGWRRPSSRGRDQIVWCSADWPQLVRPVEEIVTDGRL